MQYVYLLMQIVQTELGKALEAVTYDGVPYIFADRNPSIEYEEGEFLMAVPVQEL